MMVVSLESSLLESLRPARFAKFFISIKAPITPICFDLRLLEDSCLFINICNVYWILVLLSFDEIDRLTETFSVSSNTDFSITETLGSLLGRL